MTLAQMRGCLSVAACSEREQARMRMREAAIAARAAMADGKDFATFLRDLEAD